MKNLMHDIICSEIRIIELKLKRINFSKNRLLKNKPCRLNHQKYKEWKSKLQKIEKEENELTNILQKNYIDLEKHL